MGNFRLLCMERKELIVHGHRLIGTVTCFGLLGRLSSKTGCSSLLNDRVVGNWSTPSPAVVAADPSDHCSCWMSVTLALSPLSKSFSTPLTCSSSLCSLLESDSNSFNPSTPCLFHCTTWALSLLPQNDTQNTCHVYTCHTTTTYWPSYSNPQLIKEWHPSRQGWELFV